ncbi:unnamed protein product [Blepharisma stoltei]|uniref:Acetyl-CoA transporter n=1 Tax=Blepharisma stoltei TaxID=1481888 RepID=A0AAU9JDY1_9CILI|nr:unnamed protein product [Blepharisma stoltei]
MFDISGIDKRFLKGDLHNVILLTILYLLQGIPLGLSYASLPFLLKKHLSYSDIGIFSISAFPFSLKFLWSPLVDAYFIPQIGRRKTWIIPLQILSGFMMIFLSFRIDELVRNADNVWTITLLFTFLVFLYATQDIAVDGWALEILRPEHKSLASTCQSVGQNIGFFASFTIFLAFNSVEFCNKYIYSEEMKEPAISLPQFMYFWGVINLITSIYLILFSEEKPMKLDENQGFISIFGKIMETVKQKHFIWLIILGLTNKMFFASNDSMLMLMLMEKGVPEADLGLISAYQLPIDIIVSIVVGWYTRHGYQFKYFCYGYIIRIIMNCYGIFLLLLDLNSAYYYFFLVVGGFFGSLGSNLMFVSIGSFFNIIVDESIGGSLLTFLNTIWNFGGTWARFAALNLVDHLTFGETHGYYVLTIASAVFGVVYYPIMWSLTKKISSVNTSDWKLKTN